MAKKTISGNDLVWIIQERLASFDERLKQAPIAIVPIGRGWKVVTSRRHWVANSKLGELIEQIQAELQTVYALRN